MQQVPLFAVIAVSYGLHIAVVSYALYVLQTACVHRGVARLGQPAPADVERRCVEWHRRSNHLAPCDRLQTALDSRALPAIVYASRHLPRRRSRSLLLGFAQIAARPRGRATVAILFTIVTVASIVVPIGLRAGSVRPRPNLTTSILDRP
jgi:hypothetical protein